ncbi:hypothetical protein ACOME3_001195 [Neoechinorhynchus agilis]
MFVSVPYGDILRCPHLDTYNRNCLKTMFMIEHHIKQIEYNIALYIDDDMYVNMSILRDICLDEPVFHGSLVENGQPIRNNRSKYFVSQQDYPYRLFPRYASGGCFFLSRTTAIQLVQRRKLISFPCVIDDAYLGMLAQIANISVKGQTNLRLSATQDFNPVEGHLCSHSFSRPGKFVI